MRCWADPRQRKDPSTIMPVVDVIIGVFVVRRRVFLNCFISYYY